MKAYNKAKYNDITPINAIYSQHKENQEYKCNFRGNNKPHNFKPEENKNNYCKEPRYITNYTKLYTKEEAEQFYNFLVDTDSE